MKTTTQTLAEQKTASRDFIETYMEYSRRTSADELLHQAEALFVLAVCVGRIPIELSPEPSYPKINAVLLGVPRFTHRSSVQNLAIAVIPKKANESPTSTPERRIQRLVELEEKYGRAEIWERSDEWGSELAAMDKQYMKQYKQDSMSLEMCKGLSSGTKKEGDIFCEKPYLCSTRATTFASIRRWIKKSDIEDGMLARKLIVVGKIQEFKPRRKLTAEDYAKEEFVKEWASKIYEAFHKQEHGKLLEDKSFVLSKDAEEYYEQLDRDITERAKDSPDEAIPVLVMEHAYLEHTLPVACLVKVSHMNDQELEHTDVILVELEHIQRAWNIVKNFKESAEEFLKMIMTGKYEGLSMEEWVLNKIPLGQDKKIERSALLSKISRHVNAQKLDEILKPKINAGEVICEEVPNPEKPRYEKTYYWRPEA